VKTAPLRFVRVIRFLVSLAFAGGLGGLTPVSDSQAAGPASGSLCHRVNDDQAVVHLKAGTDLGVIQCLGIEHGKTRAFQMELFRRTTQGRRSEWFGHQELRTDFFLRLVDLRGHAQRIARELTVPTRAWLEAYASGVNQGFQRMDSSQSELLAQVGQERLEKWKVEDTLSLILLQSFDQTRKTFETEFEEASSAKTHGVTQAERWFRLEGLPWEVPILKPGEYTERSVREDPETEREGTREDEKAELPEGMQEARFPSRGFLPPFETSQEAAGSNNWALTPARSSSGRAWVANDPHLSLTHPSFWKMMHLEGHELNAIGVSFPGIPVIASGANLKVAWGLTNSYLKSADAVRVPWKDLASRVKREFPVIWIKVGGVKLPFFFKPFFRLPSGLPVLPILPEGSAGSELPEQERLVLRWSGFEVSASDIQSFFGFMFSQSAEEMDGLAKSAGVPSWSLIYGDTSGKIGYRVIGKIPRRRQSIPYGHERVTGKQLDRSQEWLSEDEIPHLIDPSRGFVATANQRPWDESRSAFQTGRAYSIAMRGFRIEEWLQARPTHDLESQRKLQCDTQVVDARFFVPLLTQKLKPILELLEESAVSPRLRTVFQGFLEWKDYSGDLECRLCGPYRRWMQRLFELEQGDERSLYRWLKEEPHLLTELRGRAWLRELELALEDLRVPSSAQSLHEFPAWGARHANPYRSVAAPYFAPGRTPSVPTPGDDHSVSPGTSDWDPQIGQFVHKSGASQRLLVHMSEVPEVYGMVPDTENDSVLQAYHQCRLERRRFPFDWKKADTGAFGKVDQWMLQ